MNDNKAENEKQPSSGEQTHDIPRTRDFAEVEKTHHHDTDTDADSISINTISSVSSSQQEERPQRSRPASRSLSRHVSESEVRDGFQNLRDPELGPELTEKVDTTAPDPKRSQPRDLDRTRRPSESQKLDVFQEMGRGVYRISLHAYISHIFIPCGPGTRSDRRGARDHPGL
ncbi:hypothetical protein NUW58_g5881 [Xylaria curta]|uniref:Uncharacterized protein n=1 Tax=Xylaria curta TaxID=42375 RepID=A0ACC1P0M8_9PEZI|nr:hypothetical protein NUW58_g5881 [Xylaria curta]